MATAPDLIIKQLTEIVDEYGRAKQTYGGLTEYDAKRILTRNRAAIRRFAPPGSTYEQEAIEIDNSPGVERWKAGQLTAVAHALRDDYEFGGLSAVQELVHADLFDDFLDMAGELLSKGFIGPGAVLAGTVLEEQLRKLAGKHEIAVVDEKGRPRSADSLSQELRKKQVLTEVQRKSVAAWYGQRNEAAHGHTDNLSSDELERVIDGIRAFVARYPA